MRLHTVFLLIALFLVIGCRTSDPHAPFVPQFDGDRRYRADYLDGFQQGYLKGTQGWHATIDCVFGPDQRANRAFQAGYRDGNEAAFRAP